MPLSPQEIDEFLLFWHSEIARLREQYISKATIDGKLLYELRQQLEQSIRNFRHEGIAFYVRDLRRLQMIGVKEESWPNDGIVSLRVECTVRNQYDNSVRIISALHPQWGDEKSADIITPLIEAPTRHEGMTMPIARVPGAPLDLAKTPKTVLQEASQKHHNTLVELIQGPCLKYGDFTLASGAKSKFYVDLRMITLKRAAILTICESINLTLERKVINGLDAIGGPVIGADPIVGAAVSGGSTYLPHRGFLVRAVAKDHGTGQQIEGPLAPFDRVLLVDDVVTSGKSLLDAAQAVKEMGCVVAAVISILDREAGAVAKFAELEIPYYPLVTLSNVPKLVEARRQTS